MHLRPSYTSVDMVRMRLGNGDQVRLRKPAAGVIAALTVTQSGIAAHPLSAGPTIWERQRSELGKARHCDLKTWVVGPPSKAILNSSWEDPE